MYLIFTCLYQLYHIMSLKVRVNEHVHGSTLYLWEILLHIKLH